MFTKALLKVAKKLRTILLGNNEGVDRENCCFWSCLGYCYCIISQSKTWWYKTLYLWILWSEIRTEHSGDGYLCSQMILGLRWKLTDLR